MRKRGFTLIELMFVFAIAGAITTMAFVGISQLKRDSRDKERMSDRDVIATAIKAYQSAKEGVLPVLGTNPATDQIVVDTNDILQDTSPLITGGYLSSEAAYQDPLARDGSGNKINYRMKLSLTETSSTTLDCTDTADGPNDSEPSTILYEVVEVDNGAGGWEPGKTFRLGVCLETGQANTVDYGM